MKQIIYTALFSSLLAACSTAPHTLAPHTSDNSVCKPAPKNKNITIEREGLTLAQVEAESLKRVKLNPNVPQVSMGLAHKEWEELKAKLKPQDRFYRATYNDGKGFSYGGYLIMRGSCVVAFWREWIS